MPRYRLLTQHYSEEDKLLEPGTEVGDGTPHLWTRPPTPEMEGLDEESQALVEAEVKRTEGRIDPTDGLSMTLDGRTPGRSVDNSMLNHPGQKAPTIVRGRG